MINDLKKACNNWWLLLILGILCVLCGISIFCVPGSGTVVMAIILTIALIVGGILGLIHVISNRSEIPAWGWNLILPVLTIIAGIILACNTGASTVLVICLFAAGVLFKSVDAICFSISMSSVQGSGWGWSLAAGIIGLLLSFTLFASPLFTGFAVSFFVAFSLLFMGIESIAVSVELSKIKGAAKRAEEEAE